MPQTRPPCAAAAAALLPFHSQSRREKSTPVHVGRTKKRKVSVCLFVCLSENLSVCLQQVVGEAAGERASCVNDSVGCELSCVVFNFIAASVRRGEREGGSP